MHEIPRKKQDLQAETRCNWLRPLKDGWEVGYQWRAECFLYKSKRSWDSGPYPKWTVTYISWCFWHHGWLREGGENLEVPTLVLACLRTVPVAAVSPWHACFTQDPEVRQAVLEHHRPEQCDSLSLEEKMWFTLSCSSNMLSRGEGRFFVNVLTILRWISSYHKHWGVDDVIFKVSHITFYLTGSSNRNAISESSQVLELLNYVNEVYARY